MNRTIRNLLLCACSLLFALPAAAQEDLRARFDAFRRQTEQRFDDFRDSARADYVKHMREAWTWYDVETAKEPPKRRETVAPVVKQKRDSAAPVRREMVYTRSVPSPQATPEPTASISVKIEPEASEAWLDVPFYNSPCRVRFNMADRVYLKGTDENGVADMWVEMASKHYDKLLHDCLTARRDMAMCDWAYVKFTETAARTVYDPSHLNEAYLLQAYLLTESGFKLRIARTAEGRLYPLVATECDICSYPSCRIEDVSYYLMADGIGSTVQLCVYPLAFPDEQPMRLGIDEEPRFERNLTPERSLQAELYREARVLMVSNKNLLAFYEDYPVPYAGDDPTIHLRFYAQTPLSETASARLYPMLRQLIAGKGEAQGAGMLLNFVQTAFDYAVDDDVWGRERVFFADETLFYPYCDCEDRAILFSRLVRDLMGLDVALVYYPGHLATAVCFNEKVTGDCYVVDDREYVVCDPTYINAGIGETMPGVDDSGAELIFL